MVQSDSGAEGVLRRGSPKGYSEGSPFFPRFSLLRFPGGAEGSPFFRRLSVYPKVLLPKVPRWCRRFSVVLKVLRFSEGSPSQSGCGEPSGRGALAVLGVLVVLRRFCGAQSGCGCSGDVLQRLRASVQISANQCKSAHLQWNSSSVGPRNFQ